MNADKRPFFASLSTVRHAVPFHRSLAIAWLLFWTGASWAAGCGAAVDGPPFNQDPSSIELVGATKQQVTFGDVTAAVGLEGMSGGEAAWGDFNNDGWVDLCAGGQIWRNEQGKRFVKIADLPGSALWADFDNDGQLDIVTGGRLLRNPGHPHHWLKVRLEGAGAVNGAAIGAQVRLRCGDQTLTRPVEGATGQGNQNDLTLHFGLGNRGEDVELEIRWPDGSRQTVKTAVDRVVTIKR